MNQFSRRNLSPYQRAELALLLEPIIAAEAAERMSRGTTADPTPNWAEGETRDTVAQTAGVGHDTIERVKVITAEADDAMKQRLRKGETTVNKEYTKARKNSFANRANPSYYGVWHYVVCRPNLTVVFGGKNDEARKVSVRGDDGSGCGGRRGGGG